MIQKPPIVVADLDLVTRALRGERDAVDRLVERAAMMRRVLTAMNVRRGRPFDAAALDDAVQEGYLTLWHRLPTYQGYSPLEAFIYRVAHFTWLGRIRKERSRHDSTEADGKVDWRQQCLDPSHELEELVHRALESLDAEEAEVVRLKHFEDLTFEEIASRVGWPTGTVKTSYYRSIRRLRATLDQEFVE